MGETGVRLVLQRLAPSAENADRLETLIRANAQDERREVMWGSPGTMLAAAALHALTGEERWLELWRESAAWLRGEWDPETDLWTQHLYGNVDQLTGPAHGFAGCVLALAATAPPATATPSSRCSRARVTSSGSTGRAHSRCTLSPRSTARASNSIAGATRSGRATREPRSTSPTASTAAATCRSPRGLM